MTYTGAMVLPQNAVRMNTNEMRYVDGGVTAKVTEKASYLVKRLNKVINCAATGEALSAALGGLVGGLIGAIIANFTGGSWFRSYKDAASAAHHKASQFSGSTMLTLTTTFGSWYICTGMSVKKYTK